MSDAEKSKPNKESTSTSTATLVSPPTAPAVTTTSKVSSSTTATTSSTSITSSSSTATSPSSSSTTSSGNASNNANSNVSSTSGNANSSSSITTKIPSKPPPPLPPPPPPPPKSQSSSTGGSRSSRHHELSEPAIRKAFADFMKDPECLDKAADYLYESLLEDAVMGVYLEVHHSVKTGALEAIEGQPEDDTAFKIVDTPNFDVFGMSTARKAMDCTCPNCDRPVAAARFAPHLEKCMGMGRKTSRTASRRLANAKEGNSSYFSSNVSDDEDDADWSSEKRRKKIQTSRTNGSKKNGKAS